jgi:hypothetical protein
MRKIIILFFPIALMTSCASLTKTQIETVNQFGQTCSGFSAFPSKILTGLAEVRMVRGIYAANSIDSADLHLQELNDIYGLNKNDNTQSLKLDITFQIIDQYAQSLVLLSSDSYSTNLKDKAFTSGVGLDSLISIYKTIDKTSKINVGIGEAVGQLIILGGKQYIKHKQAKEIKKFVTQADPLIDLMTKNLLEFLQGKHFIKSTGDSASLKYLIDYETIALQRDYLSFLRQNKASIDNEKEYLKLKSNIDAIKSLQMQAIGATQCLRKAHSQLLVIIEKKKKLKERFVGLQDLFGDVKQLYTTIGKLKF